MTTRVILGVVALLAALFVTGCTSPGGGMATATPCPVPIGATLASGGTTPPMIVVTTQVSTGGPLPPVLTATPAPVPTCPGIAGVPTATASGSLASPAPPPTCAAPTAAPISAPVE